MSLFSVLKRFKDSIKKIVGRNSRNQLIENNEQKFIYGTPISKKLIDNANQLKKVFNASHNMDFHARVIYIKALKSDGMLFFIEGMINSDVFEKKILYPLTQSECEELGKDKVNELIKKVILTKHAIRVTTIEECVRELINGNTILFIQSICEAVSMSSIGFEHRAVSKPVNENTLKGPKEAFVESSAVNRSLIRKQIRDEKLMTDILALGKKSVTHVSVMYIQDIANPQLVEDVKDRIKVITADSVQNIEILEQHIEERPYSLIPTVLYTERPDRAAAFLLEGHIVLIMDNSPACLVAPVTFWSFFHTGEDMYERWMFGNITRIIRIFSFLLAITTPALYIGITNFHQEMIPSDLVLAIAGSRETLPMPAITEVILMEAAFELIREAGVRIPTTIGPTIGIVGALILGQAAVQANIVSPMLVIIVSITGLASFAIPEISFSYVVRILKFSIIFCSAFLGFLGIAAFFTAAAVYLVGITSFGVPFFSPYTPHYRSSKDTFLRSVIRKQWVRPTNLKPQDEIRADKPKGGAG